MIAIGSVALKYWYPEVREPHDFDIVGLKEELFRYIDTHYNQIKYSYPSRPGQKYFIKLVSGKCIEFELVNTKCVSNIHIFNDSSNQPQVHYPDVDLWCRIASPDTLIAIKKSHLSVPLKRWDKHIGDYHFLKNKGASVQKAKAIYEARLYETRRRVRETNTDFNMTNDQFFKKSEPKIQRYFDHDDVHRAVAYYDQPLFTKIKKDQSKAACDKNLFMALPYKDQIRAVREEAFAIALERQVIPAIMTNQPFDQVESLKYSLFRICTTLTSGWFRNFAQDNYFEILQTDVDYVAKFRTAVNNKSIKQRTIK